MPQRLSFFKKDLWFYTIAILLYGLFYWLSIPRDYSECSLCDAHQYTKLFEYFKFGTISQIKFPFYNRPLIPWLSSLIPGSDIKLHFDVINFLFFLPSLWIIRKLWNELELKAWAQGLGFMWLLVHWTGIIRYNLYDPVTVDVPLYFFQTLGFLLFIRKDYKWFFIVVPFALLQKESFLVEMLVLVVIHFIYHWRNEPWRNGKYLVLATITGVVIQKLILALLPGQLDQRSSFDAILYHGHLVIQDPTRFVRWFAAMGSAFGLIPIFIFVNFRRTKFQSSTYSTLVLLCLMYGSFGLLAGEDMTRILFLGFPFIMTLSLMEIQKSKSWPVVLTIFLSLVSLRISPFQIDAKWSVDYAEMSYVYSWAIYYLMSTIILLIFFFFHNKRSQPIN